MPDLISDYISEQKVTTAGETAALADGYVLTHGGNDRQLAAVWSRSVTFTGGSVKPTFVEQRIRDSGKIIIAIHVVM